MDRTTPDATNEELELYIRTYYSLLRSTVPFRLRSLEETHTAMGSNLHYLASATDLDISAMTYSALRLPPNIATVKLVVMGQMEDVFQRKGYPNVTDWTPVKARARRRKYYVSPDHETLAAFISSVSDIDDLLPALVTYQIEWNKMYQKLSLSDVGARLSRALGDNQNFPGQLMEEVRLALNLSAQDFSKLFQIWPGHRLVDNFRRVAEAPLDIRVRVLGSGLTDYRRAVQFWWQNVASVGEDLDITSRPIYFISSNTHSIANLISGYAASHKEDIIDYILRENPEDLRSEYQRLAEEQSPQMVNFLYYASRIFLDNSADRQSAAAHALLHEEEGGIRRIQEPDCLDVASEIIDISRMRQDWLDPRLGHFSPEEWDLLQGSDALIFNIDYPLGMAAYHIFSQVSTAASGILGAYILGKAATLNGRVGDVMIPNVVYDEHSRNSFLFKNCFTAQDLARFLNYGTVFDNQKAVTVRGTFLQNREFMHVFYEEGYTDIEMEAGPYLSGIYENIYPKRHPTDEIVNLFINAPYDIGLIHYASDTPISRRQMLLSKSLSYFGVDATYATSLAVLRRIFKQEIQRQRDLREMEKDPSFSGMGSGMGFGREGRLQPEEEDELASEVNGSIGGGSKKKSKKASKKGKKGS